MSLVCSKSRRDCGEPHIEVTVVAVDAIVGVGLYFRKKIGNCAKRKKAWTIFLPSIIL